MDIPDLPGLQTLTPLQMNEIHFSKRHTLLSPEVLDTLGASGR